MQSHYFDIKAIPQAEMIQSAVVAHILQVLHRHLPAYNNDSDEPIALAFPAYGQGGTLGGIVRVLGNENSVSSLMGQIAELADYALITDRQQIPEKIQGYAYFYRHRFKGKSHIKHLKQRAEQRGKPWTQEYEKAVIKKYSFHEHVPFAVLKSSSTKQKQMWLHIGMAKTETPTQGQLSAYGINGKSQQIKTTIPVF